MLRPALIIINHHTCIGPMPLRNEPAPAFHQHNIAGPMATVWCGRLTEADEGWYHHQPHPQLSQHRREVIASTSLSLM